MVVIQCVLLLWGVDRWSEMDKLIKPLVTVSFRMKYLYMSDTDIISLTELFPKAILNSGKRRSHKNMTRSKSCDRKTFVLLSFIQYFWAKWHFISATSKNNPHVTKCFVRSVGNGYYWNYYKFPFNIYQAKLIISTKAHARQKFNLSIESTFSYCHPLVMNA